VKAYKNIYLAH